MELGVFARTFSRPTLEGVLDAAAEHGLSAIQFNFSTAGLPTLPDRIEDGFCAELSAAIRQRGLSLAALSGTFNLVAEGKLFAAARFPEVLREVSGEPDIAEFPEIVSQSLMAARMLDRLDRLAAACRRLDTRIITLCTGTCDLQDMWKWHPDNVRMEVWESLVDSMQLIARIADRHEVTMAIEPEVGNVVNSAVKAQMLLDAVGSPWIKVVIDPANLFHPGDLPRMREILDEAFEWLGRDICLAHAKELSPEGKAGGLALGKGVLDWDHYLGWLGKIDYRGPLIIHGLSEADLPDSIAFLRSRMDPRASDN